MFHVERSPVPALDLLAKGARELGLSLSDTQLADLLLYLRELQIWNQRINLTAMQNEEQILVKHFLDSLMCGRALRPGSTVGAMLDIGTGAGFPGLPLKVLRPDLPIVLLEPNQKRLAFLRTVIGQLKLEHVAAHPSRVEEFARQPEQRGRFTYIVSRALSPDRFLSSIGPLLEAGGRVILFRSLTPKEGPLLPDCALQMSDSISYTLPFGYGHRTLCVLERVM